ARRPSLPDGGRILPGPGQVPAGRRFTAALPSTAGCRNQADRAGCGGSASGNRVVYEFSRRGTNWTSAAASAYSGADCAAFGEENQSRSNVFGGIVPKTGGTHSVRP